ncbi:hypothetical protein [Solitalea lacus]|uniref:hypothetical protein n=1 Tax=Solitalea lacus TaxID=2911172 RepID=UPI001EDAC931|nr:hypothetical protein [Solitalea lacus]UKJ06090.1 hypothetical protein L2B55_11085 [Solitalea lacus]
MKTIILLCGIFNIGFALFHIGFWKIFNWNSKLKKTGYINKAIMQILNVQITYYFLFTAAICFIYPSELLTTSLGHLFLMGSSLFWFIRTIQQFIFLRSNHYKVHVLTLLFVIGTLLFISPVLMNN